MLEKSPFFLFSIVNKCFLIGNECFLNTFFPNDKVWVQEKVMHLVKNTIRTLQNMQLVNRRNTALTKLVKENGFVQISVVIHPIQKWRITFKFREPLKKGYWRFVGKLFGIFHI